MSSRRDFLKLALASAAGAIAGGSVWADIANGAINDGPGPYGPLSDPDINGIQLPAGFSSRIIARTGDLVENSSYPWHVAPDGGACFSRPAGGWVYVSNSEVVGTGGVGVIQFAPDGAITAAYSALRGSNRNCSGGRTPWGTWLSCEEMATSGRVWETDPLGVAPAVVRDKMGVFGHEAACVDPVSGIVYMSEDDPAGRFYRFVPTKYGDLSKGTLQAASRVAATGQLTWVNVSTLRPERSAATTGFNRGEGIYHHDGTVYLVTTGDHRIWALNLQTQVMLPFYQGTIVPRPALRWPDGITVHDRSRDMFITEDGDNMEICVISIVAGVRQVTPFLRLVGHDTSECTGPAFSPDGNRFYFSSQRGLNGAGIGLTYEITGPFRGAANPTVLTPVQDTYARDGEFATQSFGTANPLQIRTDPNLGENRVAYISFDTTAFTGVVTTATLNLTGRLVAPGAATIDVWGAGDANIREAKLNWDNRPPLGTRLLGSFAMTTDAVTSTQLDLTAYVTARRLASSRIVLALVQPTPGQLATIRSREALAGKPTLTLT